MTTRSTTPTATEPTAEPTTTSLEEALARIASLEAQIAAATASRPTARTAASRLPHPCACGCGEETKSLFAMGHDARLRSDLINDRRDAEELDPELVTTLLARDPAHWAAALDGSAAGERRARAEAKVAARLVREQEAATRTAERKVRSLERQAAKLAATAQAAPADPSAPVEFVMQGREPVAAAS